MSCLSLTMSKSVLPVLMIAACWDALLVVQNKGVAFSSPATETRIKPTTDEQDVSDLLKSTESAILTEQFPSESTKPFFQGASTVIKKAELELTQQDSAINEETELATNTPATGLNITRESSQDATTDTPNGLELTQQDSTINEETELATNTPPTGLNISRESSQDATTDTPNGLELTQQDSTTNEETELATNTPSSGSHPARDFSQISTQIVETTNDASVTGVVASETNAQSSQTLLPVFPVTSATSSVLPSSRKPYTPVYRCLRSGRFPSRSSCTEYHECRRVGSWLVHFKGKCSFGRSFSVRYSFCVRSRLSDCKPYSIPFDGGNRSSEFQDSDSDESESHNENGKNSKTNRLNSFLNEKNNRHSWIYKRTTLS